MNALISLIVCTLGRTETLERLLNSLRQQTYRRFEIILVDQNPAGFLDPIVEAFSDLPIVRLKSRKGLSRGRNVGLARCEGDIVAFPDDDCWYDPGVLFAVHAFFSSNPGIDIYSGRTVDRSGRDSVSRHLRASADITPAKVFLIGNSNTFFVRRMAATDAGGFDENLGVGSGTPFQSGEESDFLLKCMANGCRGYYDYDFKIRHDQIAASPLRARSYSRGFGRVARIHSLGTGFFISRSARTLAGGCLRLAKGDMRGARERFEWLVGSIGGYAASHKSRPEVRRGQESARGN
jgi:glycosyltransferase involved in cell wall biosynthesis